MDKHTSNQARKRLVAPSLSMLDLKAFKNHIFTGRLTVRREKGWNGQAAFTNGLHTRKSTWQYVSRAFRARTIEKSASKPIFHQNCQSSAVHGFRQKRVHAAVYSSLEATSVRG